MMKCTISVCIVFATLLQIQAAMAGDVNNPLADPKAVVVAGKARFTVLAPSLVRMEWSADGKFEDRASQVFVNRRLPVPKFTTGDRQGYFVLSTDKITILYKTAGGRFAANNLTVTAKIGPNDKTVDSAPPFHNDGNLGGTTRTLDGISGACPLENGLLSRNGWTCLDDSKSLLLDGDPPWATPRRPVDAQDYYFFCYGTDYKSALADFIKVAGRIPLPPRFAFGAWWSRYWAYSADELKQLVKEFREHDVPLDVLVVDMDWHLDGWTGYTWNPKYFPDPDAFLRWAHERGLKVTLNLHPAEGVGKHEKAFQEMCRAMGFDPDKAQRIPFNSTDRKYVDAYFNVLHRPLERQGVDFWWLDWQQGKTTDLPGLDPLWWLNNLHWSDMEKQAVQTGRRPLLFSRWGGLGNHRYQIGFSGDTFCNWPSLAFQPYFTATAGNVGYAYWSHDIGGHQPGKVDPELYVRWLQWGALSPILRTHTTKNPEAERRIWEFPTEYFEAGRKAYQLRYELIPYIYTAARQCYDTGVPICRPLYYEWPELDEAYNHGGEYLFGDQMLVAPVTEPSDPISGCAMVEVWLPPGQWTNWFTGRTYEGPKTVPLVVPLDEIPIFVKSGGIIVTLPKMAYSDEKPTDKLIINIFPGDSGETRLYEDEGRSNAYARGNCAWTPISQKLADGRRIVNIGSASGNQEGLPPEREFLVRLRDVSPEKTVWVDGKELAKNRKVAPPWTMYGRTGHDLDVQLDRRAIERGAKIIFQPAPGWEDESFMRGGGGQIVRLLQRLLLKEDIRESLSSVKGIPQNASSGELNRWFGEIWPKAVKTITESRMNEEQRRRLLVQVLGLFYRIELPAEEISSTVKMAVRIDVASTLPDELLEGITGEIKVKLAPGWNLLGPSKLSFGKLSRDVPVRFGLDLTNEFPISTGVIQAQLSLRKSDIVIDIPFNKTVLPSINAWWILGPFEGPSADGLRRVFPPESLIDFNQLYPGKDGERIKWRKYSRRIKPGDDLTCEFFVDFDDAFGKRVNDCVVYGFTWLESPQDLDAVLALGSDDGIAVWLNDVEVFRHEINRPYSSKSDHAPVKLKKGTNRLLVKVAQGGGDGGFCVHIEDAAGKPLTQVKPRLTP